MDLDVLAKNAQSLIAFKGELETVLPQLRKAITDVVVVSGDVDEVRAILTPALEKIEAMKPAIEAVVADVAEIKGTLGPALAWIAAQQKAVETANAQTEHAEKTPAEKPAEPADKPLEHLAEVEASLDAAAARNESETTAG